MLGKEHEVIRNMDLPMDFVIQFGFIFVKYYCAVHSAEKNFPLLQQFWVWG